MNAPWLKTGSWLKYTSKQRPAGWFVVLTRHRERRSPYGVEWMRFEKSSPLPELIKTLPHVAFEVDDLEAALEGQEVIYPPGSPSEGVRAAIIGIGGYKGPQGQEADPPVLLVLDVL